MNDNLAIIFDMDGVLVDTYHAHYRSWLAMAEPEGFRFTEEEFAVTFGRTSREIIAHFWGEGRLNDEQIAVLDENAPPPFVALYLQAHGRAVPLQFLQKRGGVKVVVNIYFHDRSSADWGVYPAMVLLL